MMRRCSVRPYEGKKEYIFVSYCHKDKAYVYPIIEQLVKDGYRVWYDEGIDPGSEWPEIIANHLNNCSMCLAFISKKSLNSHNCRREINFALLKKKFFISVILEPVTMSLGMEMQLSSSQSIFKYTLSSDRVFFDKLYCAKEFEPCFEKRMNDVIVSKYEDYLEENDDIGRIREPFSDKWFVEDSTGVYIEPLDNGFTGDLIKKSEIEAECKAAEEAERQRIEAERKAAEEAERQRIEAEHKAAEDAERQRMEAERKATEEVKRQRIEAERKAAEEAKRQRIEAERKAAEEVERQRIEAEREAAEEAERQKIESECKAAKETNFATYRKWQQNISYILSKYKIYGLYAYDESVFSKKLGNAITSYATQAANEIPLLLYDNTATGSGIDGFLLTNKNIYVSIYRNIDGAIAISNLKSFKYDLNDDRISVLLETEQRRYQFYSGIIEKSNDIRLFFDELLFYLMSNLIDNNGAHHFSHILKREKTNEMISINKSEFVIGRSETRADYIIRNNSFIGRIHAQIKIRDSKAYIVDQNSLNKTYLNGVMLKPGFEYELKNNDIVKFYNETFIYLKFDN